MKREHEDAALRHFKKVDPILYKAAKKHAGTLVSHTREIRGTDALFASLASSVVSQQLSTKAAETIWGRLKKICGGRVTPDSILKTSLPHLRKAGLSAAKVKTLKELAKALKKGLNLPALRRIPEDEAIAQLTSVWGIGTWTAEMFLIFALGRADIFSPKDLGLVRSMEELYGIERGAKPEVFITLAQEWAPYRSVASLALWRLRDSK